MDNNTTIERVSEDGILPPLPASDPEAIAQNKFHGFYGVGSRTYWKNAEVNLNHLREQAPHEHYFLTEGSFIKCRTCNIGYFGPGVRAINGKLLINNQAVF